MGRLARILLGCSCLLVLATVGGLALVGWGAWWAKDRLTEAAGGLGGLASRVQEIDRWEEEARAHAYEAPPDGVVPEERLLKFLETRRRVYAVYERYEGDLRELKRKGEPRGDELTPSDLWSAGGTLAEAVAEIRLAQLKALAELGMSEDEYRDIQIAVYKTAWASDVEKGSGRMPAEAVSGSMAEAARGVEDAVRAGLETARREGVPGSHRVSDDDVRKLQEEVARLGQGAGEALEVPRANVELFRRHEAEIRKYAMNALAYVGL